MVEPLVEARGLWRTFGATTAVSNVHLALQRGDVVAFVGKNGAGKSTTLRMLAGALLPTRGEALVCGVLCSSVEARRSVGYAPEAPLLDPDLSVDEQLAFAAALRGLAGRPRDLEVARVLSLTDTLDHRRALTSTLSKGTRQRVGIAQALLGDPPVLLLDEPSSGLDPAQIEGLLKLLEALKDQHAVLVSTHHVSELLPVCTRAVALQRGRVVLDRARAELGDDAARTLLTAITEGAA